MVVSLTLGTTTWNRSVPQEAAIPLQNRFLEKNPASLRQASAIIRPGLKRLLYVGDGPIRGIYSEPGNFNEAVFSASGASVYQVDTDLTVTNLGGISDGDSAVIFTSTSSIGTVPSYLFLTDGLSLYGYAASGFATGTLSLTALGSILNNDEVQIGGAYYKWTNASVDAGTPAGTSASPWLVNLGASNLDALTALFKALNGTGTPGTDYSTVLTFNALAQAVSTEAKSLTIRALNPGTAGNAVSTTVITGAALSWTGTTLSGGGSPSFFVIPMPNDEAPCSVVTLASYVLVSVGANQNENGRFYWIEPGETFIRPLNFDTAEQAPDATLTSRVIGDQVFFFGQSTTEVWYASGQADTPFQRVQGQVFARGVWGGTDVRIKENLLIVDPTGVVYNIGGGINRVSTPGVEQLLREAIIAQAGA